MAKTSGIQFSETLKEHKKTGDKLQMYRDCIIKELVDNFKDEFFVNFDDLTMREVRKIMINSSEAVKEVIVEEVKKFKNATPDENPTKRSKAADKKGAENSVTGMPVAAEESSADGVPGSPEAVGEVSVPDSFQAPYTAEESEPSEMLL